MSYRPVDSPRMRAHTHTKPSFGVRALQQERLPSKSKLGDFEVILDASRHQMFESMPAARAAACLKYSDQNRHRNSSDQDEGLGESAAAALKTERRAVRSITAVAECR